MSKRGDRPSRGEIFCARRVPEAPGIMSGKTLSDDEKPLPPDQPGRSRHSLATSQKGENLSWSDPDNQPISSEEGGNSVALGEGAITHCGNYGLQDRISEKTSIAQTVLRADYGREKKIRKKDRVKKGKACSGGISRRTNALHRCRRSSRVGVKSL